MAGEEEKLLRFERAGRDHLDDALALKSGAKDLAIGRLGKFDRAPGLSDVNTIANERDVFRSGEFGWIENGLRDPDPESHGVLGGCGKVCKEKKKTGCGAKRIHRQTPFCRTWGQSTSR